MSKRKSKSLTHGAEENGSDNESLLNVDFEYFDPQEHDYHGLRALLDQLFSPDSQLLPTNAIADAIIAQPLLGSTVKVENEEQSAQENDPFAFLTVLNLHAHRNNAAIRSLVDYLQKRAESSPALKESEIPHVLQKTTQDDGQVQVGCLLGERLINMPPEISPPMYNMLLEEIEWAVEEDEPYKFTHYLIVSKTYTEVESTLPGMDLDDEGGAPRKKKQKGLSKMGKDGRADQMLFFHPEDEVFIKHATAAGGFRHEREGEESSDSKRAFSEAGIKPQGGMYLIRASTLKQAIEDVKAYIGAGAVADEDVR